MQHPHSDIAIIGAGLSGLTLAYRLRNSGKSIRILEARSRVGGRIHTLYPPQGPPLEMGATWLGRKHTALWKLLEELGVQVFEQQQNGHALYQPGRHAPVQYVELPPAEEPSYRIAGGSNALIRALADRIPETEIRTGQAVTAVRQLDKGVEIATGEGRFTTDVIVSTMPPDLLLRTVAFEPAWPKEYMELARQTDTWMGKSIKVALAYDRPFWRDKGLSGTLFSNVGPITEMYDHSNRADTAFALKGFVDPGLNALAPAERRQRVVDQLERFYGPPAADFTGYTDCPWAGEPATTDPAARDLAPHQNQGHPAFRQPQWGGALWLAGTETAEAYPGYMEGAVRSGEYTARALVG